MWTLSRILEKKLGGTYTCLVTRAQNLSWKRHPPISQTYNKLTSVSSLVKHRSVQFAGHCSRAGAKVVYALLLWKPSYG